MKRLSSLIIIVLILLICSGVVVAAEPGLDNFVIVCDYAYGQFTDVSPSAWYYNNVVNAYQLGLMKGSSETTFNAAGNITIAETIALACRLHSTYYDNGKVFNQGSTWYQVYVSYALANGIISQQYADYNKKATRAEFAEILAGALPDEALTAINTVVDGGIPDVSMSASYQSAVYKLYRAGVLTGNDAKGTFAPSSYISRNAVATIVARMADPDLRQSINLTKITYSKTKLSSTEIYEQCAPAVFYIEVTCEDYNASGSGFFISADGDAITNYHVIDGASSAIITLPNDPNQYAVTSVLGYDVDKDIAIIHIDGNFDYLELADSSKVYVGQQVYALGCPTGIVTGIKYVISSGLISSLGYIIEGQSFMQTTAAISHGSSGGALLNEYGEVIGITSRGGDDVGIQNVNFAIPSNLINTIPRTNPMTLPEVYATEYPMLVGWGQWYQENPTIPNFGYFFNVYPTSYWSDNSDGENGMFYTYDYWEVVNTSGYGKNGPPTPLQAYGQYLLNNGFTYEGSETIGDNVFYGYSKGEDYVAFGLVDDSDVYLLFNY